MKNGLKIKKTAAEEAAQTTAENQTVESQAAVADIVLSDGSVVEEHVTLEDVKDTDFSKITKEDGTEIYLETPEAEEGEMTEEDKKNVYEAVLSADSEATQDVLEAIDSEDEEEEIEEVMYAPVAMNEAKASLKNSYYVFKLKSGKVKALKAGHLLSPKLQEIVIKAGKAGKDLQPTEVFAKIASKVGKNNYGAFRRIASKFAKQAGTIPVTMAVAQTTVPDGKKNITMAVKDGENGQVAKNEFGAPSHGGEATSNVHNFYNKLPSKSTTDKGLEIALGNPKKEGNDNGSAASGSKVQAGKTTAAQMKELRASMKLVASLKAEKEALEKELKEVKASLEKEQKFKRSAARLQMQSKIVEAMHLGSDAEKAVMMKKLASYSDEKLEGTYEILTSSPALDVDKAQAEEYEAIQKKMASLSQVIPATTLSDGKAEEEMDMGAFITQLELASQTRNF